MMSPICILHGVPPRICPAFKSCNISPATAAETQTIAATPRTVATPASPDTPKATNIKAVVTKAVRVKPLIGLLLEPIIPTRYPETAPNKNARTINNVAATIETSKLALNAKNAIIKVKAATAKIPTIIQLKGISFSVRSVSTLPPPAALRTSPIALFKPSPRLLRILNNVKQAPINIPPIAIGRTIKRHICVIWKVASLTLSKAAASVKVGSFT